MHIRVSLMSYRILYLYTWKLAKTKRFIQFHNSSFLKMYNKIIEKIVFKQELYYLSYFYYLKTFDALSKNKFLPI